MEKKTHTILIALCFIYIFMILKFVFIQGIFLPLNSVFWKTNTSFRENIQPLFCLSVIIQYEKDIVSAYSAEYVVWQQVATQLPCFYL